MSQRDNVLSYRQQIVISDVDISLGNLTLIMFKAFFASIIAGAMVSGILGIVAGIVWVIVMSILGFGAYFGTS